MLLSVKQIAAIYSISTKTVRRRLTEIEEEISLGRYPKKSVIRDMNIVRVNEMVFADYMYNRSQLRGKNTRKWVPEYRKIS